MELKAGWWIVLINLAIISAHAQTLFESSHVENHQNTGSSTLSLGGFIRSNVFLGTTGEVKNPYLQSVYSQVGFLINAKVGEWARGKADIRFKYGNEFRQTISEMEIREAYLDFSAGSAGIRVGKLIAPWGKATVFNPVEKITPLDPTVRSAEEDDIYLGVWALQGQYALGSLMKLTCTWKPLYQSSVLLIDPVPLPGYVNFMEAVQPGVELNEGSYGINFDLHSRLLDASVYWFDGYHHWTGLGLHSFEVDSSTLEPKALNIGEHPYRIKMVGLDISLPLGSWIIRAEGAWQKSTINHNEFEYLPFPELSYTTEIEWSASQSTLLAGYYGKYIIDHISSQAEPSLSTNPGQFLQLTQMGIPLTEETINGIIGEKMRAFNRLYNYQLEEKYHSVFFIWKGNLWYDQVELTFPVIYNITTEEWVLQPKISYAPTDGVRITAGFSSLYGPNKSLFNLVGPVLNAGYLSLKLTF